MLFYLNNYDQVKVFCDKLEELNMRPPFEFHLKSLIHFIEDYDDFLS
jgi:hypothetical protein